jgi:hypothetical protein
MSSGQASKMLSLVLSMIYLQLASLRLTLFCVEGQKRVARRSNFSFSVVNLLSQDPAPRYANSCNVSSSLFGCWLIIEEFPEMFTVGLHIDINLPKFSAVSANNYNTKYH